ncbi:TetR/AcrR family transcriptional regulator [Nocardia asiatica]|uniref:TetR/AcrR family transcriptional regulator n=1 Tax=Nocardia asiatica TaxID=209252 RepID=UPI003EDE93B8
MPSKPRRSPKPQERQRDPERTRKLIMDAAVAEFGAHGYAGARISAIAARAGVNVQLISYYFDGKEGLYQAMSQQWQERQRELVPAGTPLPEQLRRYAMEAWHNPAGPRLLAWSGLGYTGPGDDPDRAARARNLSAGVEELRALQAAGRLPSELDARCVLVMLMAAAMAPTTLPHIIDGLCDTDPTSREFIEHFADQLAVLARHIGLDAG